MRALVVLLRQLELYLLRSLGVVQSLALQLLDLFQILGGKDVAVSTGIKKSILLQLRQEVLGLLDLTSRSLHRIQPLLHLVVLLQLLNNLPLLQLLLYLLLFDLLLTASAFCCGLHQVER